MRFTLLAMTAIFLVASPAWAAKEKKGEETEFKPVFGKTYCKPTIPCPGPNKDEMKIIEDKALSVANNCVNRKLLSSSAASNGFFEENFGLNANLCFKSKKMPKGKSGLAFTPECCVKPVPNKPQTCQVVCTLYGIQ